MKFKISNQFGLLCLSFNKSEQSIPIEIEGNTRGYTLIATHPDGRQFYEPIINGIASIPMPREEGTLRLCMHKDGEPIIPFNAVVVTIREDGTAYLTYSFEDLSEAYKKLMDEFESFKKQYKDLREYVDTLYGQLNKLTEGYDLD